MAAVLKAIAYMSTDWNGTLDAQGNVLDPGTRGWCFTRPKDVVVHRDVECIEAHPQNKTEVN